MPPLLSLVVLLGLTGPSARVTAPSLEVFDAPGGTATRTGRLKQGATVVVRGQSGDWLEIVPPPGSFSWVDGSAIDEAQDGRARVISQRAEVRTGRPGARLPGPPGIVLERGREVRLLSRPPLRLGEGRSSREFRAITPPEEESRFVKVAGTDRDEPPEILDDRTRRVTLGVVDPGLDSPLDPPSEVAPALERIEVDHRRALRGSLELWHLEPIRDAYRTLLESQTSPSARSAVQARLDQTERQIRLADDARTLRSALDRGRGRDHDLPSARRPRSDLAKRPRRDYDVRGLLQPSSRQVDGQSVFAIIGPDGSTTAYVVSPPGLEAGRLIGHQVGIRGKPRPRLEFGAKLLEMQDLDDLSD